jgi:hypothetical protein
MAKVSIQINIPAFNAFRNQPEIQQELHRRGEQIAAAAGGAPDFVVVDSPNPTRARTVVITATPKAMEEEATRRSLTRALDAGRG